HIPTLSVSKQAHLPTSMPRKSDQEQRAIIEEIVRCAERGQRRALKWWQQVRTGGEIVRQQGRNKCPDQRSHAFSWYNIIVSCPSRNIFGQGKIAQSGNMIGMEMRDQNAADVSGSQPPARQLGNDRQFGFQAQWRGIAIQRKGQGARNFEHARRIAGIPEQPTVARVMQQSDQRMAGDPAACSTLEDMIFPGETITSIKD